MNTSSQAAQVVIAVIPIAGIMKGGAVALLYLIYAHKQKMLMIEKGVFRKTRIDLRGIVFFSGFPLSATGLGLTIFFAIKEGINYGMLSGIIPLFIGISFIIYNFLKHSTTSDRG